MIDRLVKYLEYKGINPHSFEKTCNLANGYLKKQLKGRGAIGSDILEKIYNNYFDLSLTWLVSGNGDMIGQNEGNSFVKENNPPYTKDEKIRFLTERIALLEKALIDKEKIIKMLEEKANRKA
jgi:hypothetical protein